MNERGIAWGSDVKYKFGSVQPEYFNLEADAAHRGGNTITGKQSVLLTAIWVHSHWADPLAMLLPSLLIRSFDTCFTSCSLPVIWCNRCGLGCVLFDRSSCVHMQQNTSTVCLALHVACKEGSWCSCLCRLVRAAQNHMHAGIPLSHAAASSTASQLQTPQQDNPKSNRL